MRLWMHVALCMSVCLSVWVGGWVESRDRVAMENMSVDDTLWLRLTGLTFVPDERDKPVPRTHMQLVSLCVYACVSIYV
jgi:hypothetical protein